MVEGKTELSHVKKTFSVGYVFYNSANYSKVADCTWFRRMGCGSCFMTWF